MAVFFEIYHAPFEDGTPRHPLISIELKDRVLQLANAIMRGDSLSCETDGVKEFHLILNQQNSGLLVSTDAIESLFGLVKHQGTGDLQDPNRMALRLPSLCSEVSMEEAERVVNIPHCKLREIQQCIPSIQKDRINIFSGKKHFTFNYRQL